MKVEEFIAELDTFPNWDVLINDKTEFLFHIDLKKEQINIKTV